MFTRAVTAPSTALAAALLLACGTEPDSAAASATTAASSSSSASGSSSSTSSGTSELVSHLVIDSGSSGTRFCVFDVARDTATMSCTVGDAAAICGKSDGGLATIALGKAPADVPALVTPNLEAAWKALEAAYTAAGRDPATLANLRYAAALGTGGYRDPATAAPASKPEWDAVWTTIADFLAKKGLTDVVSKAILGEDEARMAWVGVREAVAPAGNYAIIETGGATLQLAAGAPADAYDALVGTSVYRGQNYEFTKLAAEPDFVSCYSPMDLTKQDGEKCIALLVAKVHSGNALVDLGKTVTPRALYGLGAPWTGMFRDFPAKAPWTPKTDATLSPELALADLHALATKVCPLPDAEIAKFAPNSFDVAMKTGKSCYAVSFATAYFESVKAVATDGAIRAGGDDQWARGASVTPKFFSDCK